MPKAGSELSSYLNINPCVKGVFIMVIKLNCMKSEVVGGITQVEVVGGITQAEVVGGITGITRYRSPERKQALFFQKLLEKLHEVTFQ